MRDRRACNDAVIGISPFARPDAGLVLAVCAAGAVGVLDLGLGDRPAREALGRLRAAGREPYGVRVGLGCVLSPADLSWEGHAPAGRCPGGSPPPTTVVL